MQGILETLWSPQTAHACLCPRVLQQNNNVFDYRIWARLKSMESSGTYSAAPLAHTRDGIDHYAVNDELMPADDSSEGEELLGELVCAHVLNSFKLI